MPLSPDAALTFQNQNLQGIGTFDNQTANIVGFRGVASANSFMTVSLDAPNKTALFTIDINALAAALPAATTTQPGVLETATDAEAIAKTATDKIITPSNLAALPASTTFAGFVELSTNAEAIAGVSTTLAITPANLAAVNAGLLSQQVFADAPARSVAVPDFAGQFGGQANGTGWVGHTLVAGDWNQLIYAGQNTLESSGNITADGSLAWTFDSNDGTGEVYFNGLGLVKFQNGSNILFENNPVTLSGGTLSIGTSSSLFVDASSSLNMGAGAEFQLNTIAVPGNSVITTSGVAGDLSSALRNTFLSNANVQTGYTPITNPATIRTYNSATVTLPQLAQALGTLIEDLKAILVPAS